MDLPVFPIFDLKVIDEFVIAGGGGGDPIYGKKNGVVVYDLTTYKGKCFCETDDVIEKIKVWDSSNKFSTDLDDKNKVEENFSYENEETELEDSMKYEDVEEGTKKDTDKVEEDTKKETDKVVEDIKKDTVEKVEEENKSGANLDGKNTNNTKIETKVDDKNTMLCNNNNLIENYSLKTNLFNNDRIISDKKEEDTFSNEKIYFIIACGLKNFYYIKLQNNEMQLLQKIEGKIDYCYFHELFIFVHKNRLYGISDTSKIEIYEKPEYKRSIYQSNAKFSQDHEEYFYSIKKKGTRLSFHREDMSQDIPENWVSFFIVENYIHKVLKQNNKYVFVFQGVKYKFEDEVCEPFYNHKLEELVFYLKSEKSLVCFYRRNYKKSVLIDRITDLNVNNNVVSIADADGQVFIFDEQRNYIVKKVYNLPLTGCAVKDNYVYYTSFNGLIDRKKIRTHKFYYFLLVLSVLFSIMFYYVTKSKK